jgi:hypothetical protein
MKEEKREEMRSVKNKSEEKRRKRVKWKRM